MRNVNYEWKKKFESKEEAIATANSFHEELYGNYDYWDSNIVLTRDWKEVTLTEFEGSNTHVHVEEEGGNYILELFKLKP